MSEPGFEWYEGSVNESAVREIVRMKKELLPSNQHCTCPNASYGVRHSYGCLEGQIEKLTAELGVAKALGEKWTPVLNERDDAIAECARLRALRHRELTYVAEAASKIKGDEAFDLRQWATNRRDNERPADETNAGRE